MTSEKRVDLWPGRIRELRVRRRWTQKQLASRLRALDPWSGCDDGTVSRWERGMHRPSPLHEHLLCELFEAMVLAGEPSADDRMAYVRRALAFDLTEPRPSAPTRAQAQGSVDASLGFRARGAIDRTHRRNASR